MAKQKYIDAFKKDEWLQCPMCGFQDCHIYKRGKNKGLHRCFECNIRFKKPEIINGIR